MPVRGSLADLILCWFRYRFLITKHCFFKFTTLGGSLMV